MKPFKLLPFVCIALLLTPLIPRAQVHIGQGAFVRIERGAAWVLTGDLHNDGSFHSDTASVLRLAGTQLQTLLGSGNTLSGHLQQANPQGLELIAPLQVTRSLALDSGAVRLQDSDLQMLQGAVWIPSSHPLITQGSGMLRRHHPAGDTLLYPLATASGPIAYTPVWVHNLGAAEEIGVRVYEEAYDAYTAAGEPSTAASNQGRVRKTWVLHEATPGSNPVEVRLQFDPSQEGPGFDRSACGIDYYQGGWQMDPNPGPAQGTGPYTQSRTLNTPLQHLPLVLSSNQSNLPVEFVSFEVAQRGNIALLTWTTLFERQNAYFAVEMSLDGQLFQELGRVEGRGNRDVPQIYHFEDLSLPHYPVGRVYYRLRQVDLNGSLAYSEIRSLLLDAHTPLLLQLYPNPTQGVVFLELFSRQEGYLDLILCDASGRRLQYRREPLSVGNGQLQFDLSGLAKGLYFLHVNHDTQNQTFRILTY